MHECVIVWLHVHIHVFSRRRWQSIVHITFNLSLIKDSYSLCQASRCRVVGKARSRVLRGFHCWFDVINHYLYRNETVFLILNQWEEMFSSMQSRDSAVMSTKENCKINISTSVENEFHEKTKFLLFYELLLWQFFYRVLNFSLRFVIFFWTRCNLKAPRIRTVHQAKMSDFCRHLFCRTLFVGLLYTTAIQ